jgi:membrane-associated protease RseP (regulator of RpoE activity)
MTIPYTDSLPVSTPTDPYLSIIKTIFRIDDVTWGTDQQNFLVRYHGKLLMDSEEAYRSLVSALKPLDVTPLFRVEEGRETIVLLKGIVQPKPSNPWINLILFILTGLSVLFAGAFFQYTGPMSTDLEVILPYLIQALINGALFGISLLAILLAHEFGHYLAARYNRSAVTLPYFIPFPLSPFGTMGAFIQLKEPPRNKRVLLDIGLAGPLAGLVIAVPILFLGLYLSDLGNLPSSLRIGQSFSLEGNSIFYLVSKYVMFGKWLPEPVTFGDVSPILYWVRYFFTGRPIPLGGEDVLLHPIAWAGWSGLLVTALNLIPAGQLDGGHVLYVLLGRRVRAFLPFILVLMVVLGTVWSGWWLWAFLIFLLGRVHAEPLDQITPLDNGRKALAIFGLALFFLLFTPIPLSFF